MLRHIEQMANEMTARGQEPRKHHLVPRFYLQRWAENDKVRATELDSKRTFTPSPQNAARRTDFYRLEEGTYQWGSPVAWEAFLSVIEGRVSTTTEALVTRSAGLRDLSTEELQELMWFLALQFTRGMNFRRSLLWMLVQQHVVHYESSGDDSLKRVLSEGGYETTEENVTRMRQQLAEMRTNPTRLPMLTALKVKHSADSAANVYPHLASRLPVIYHTPRQLVTCDEPVIAIDEDMGSRDGEFGIGNAPIIVYPLAPDVVLALFRRDFPIVLSHYEPLTHSELLALNQSILGNTYLHGFELPSRHLTTQLYVPPLAQPGERIVVARRPNGEEVHKLTPGRRRWRGQPQAPRRPVQRWWP
ncbi:hypothetical protein X011_17765 [Mycobacterium tuberculosis variant microti OV254]|nr:hypothetical protein X011_17765 [Mycobacterium tuberculosis variant microti OV254]